MNAPFAPETFERLRRLRLHAAAVPGLAPGDQRTPAQGRGTDFDQLIPYQWGDDIRDMDWKVTARLGTPHRRAFRAEREQTLLLLVEDEPGLDFGSGRRTRRQALIEMAGLLLLFAAIHGIRAGLLHRRPEAQVRLAATRRPAVLMAAAGRLLASAPADPHGPPPAPWSPTGLPAGARLVRLGDVPGTPPPPTWRRAAQRMPPIGIRADDRWDVAAPAAAFTAYDPHAGRFSRYRPGPAASRAHAAWRAARDARWQDWFPAPEDRLTIPPDGEPLAALEAFLRRQPGRP